MCTEKYEKELRFILSSHDFEAFRNRVRSMSNHFKVGNALLEMTVMFDNPNPDLTFYSSKVDGRLRLRTSSPTSPTIFDNYQPLLSNSILTWKQRIPDQKKADIQVEKEIEVAFDNNETPAMLSILTNVLKCPRISSYERYRETFYTESVEIASDKFPYGHVVELELKNGDELNLIKLSNDLGLCNMLKSNLSCDSLYKKLCNLANISPKEDILFCDKTMPQIDDYLEQLKDFV